MQINQRGYIWDLARKTHVSTIHYDGDIPAFSPDTTCLASSCGTSLKIWKRNERRHEHQEVPIRHLLSDSSVRHLSLSADGHLVATTTAHMTKVWDVTIGTSLSMINGAVGRDDQGYIASVFSTNSMFIACLSGWIFNAGTVFVWNVHTHSLVKSIKVGRTGHIAVSSDGSRLASVSSYDITIWDLAIERPIAKLEHEFPDSYPYSTAPRLRVEFTVDGNTVLITDRNRIDYWCIYPALSSSPIEYPMRLVHMPSWTDHDQPCSYYEDGGWILRQDLRRMLWLPSDKRSTDRDKGRMTDGRGEKFASVSQDENLYIFDFSNVSMSW